MKVQYQAGTAMSPTTGIQPNLNIYNEGPSAVDLRTVKVHYYFTAEGCTTLAFNCFYAGGAGGVMCPTNIVATFVPMGANATATADTYLEVSFNTGTLSPTMAVSVNFGIHDANNYTTNFSQTNDWSFYSYTGSTSYVDAPYITAYLNGTLAWGIEPGPLPSDGGRGDGAADGSLGDGSVLDAGDGG